MSDIHILNDDINTSETSNKEITSKSFLEAIDSYLIGLQSLKTKDKVIFFRLLSTMINAGISILKALSILEKQEKNPVLKKILNTFIENIREGKTFSYCLGLYPMSFSAAEMGVVESGEKTGKLNSALLQLADQVEKLDSINGKIKSAMMYPSMVMIVVLGVVSIMMIVVVPKLLEIFGYNPALSLDDPINIAAMDKLPWTTQLLISISNAFTNHWLLMAILLILGIFFLLIWKQTPTGKYKWDKFLINIPVFGDINRKMILSKFSRVLSSLLSSGVSIVESLRITSEAVGNEVYKQRILLIKEDIQQGMKIYESIEGDDLFPEMLIQMVQVGEQTAKLDTIILKLADFYDEQVDNTVATINKLLEPIIIVFMAVVVGFIAISIMQPIMNLADQVSQG